MMMQGEAYKPLKNAWTISQENPHQNQLFPFQFTHVGALCYVVRSSVDCTALSKITL